MSLPLTLVADNDEEELVEHERTLKGDPTQIERLWQWKGFHPKGCAEVQDC